MIAETAVGWRPTAGGQNRLDGHRPIVDLGGMIRQKLLRQELEITGVTAVNQISRDTILDEVQFLLGGMQLSNVATENCILFKFFITELAGVVPVFTVNLSVFIKLVSFDLFEADHTLHFFPSSYHFISLSMNIPAMSLQVERAKHFIAKQAFSSL